MNRKEIDIICFHEAGHAVMAFACSTYVESVSANPEPGVWYRYPSDFPCQLRSLISLSGIAADFIFWKLSPDVEKQANDYITGDKCDQRHALKELQEIDQSQCLDIYIGIAVKMLESNLYKMYLCEIAHQLILKNRLSLQEIEYYYNNIPKFKHHEMVEYIDRIVAAGEKALILPSPLT